VNDEAFLREEICRVGRSLFERAYVHATAGNISVRLNDGFLITPTDACLGHLDPARLARLDAAGVQIGGDRASKTLALHRRIYGAAAEAACVIHTHSTHLVALTLEGVWRADDILPPITPYYVMKVGHVPLIPYHRPGDPGVGDLVAPQPRRGQCRAGRTGRDGATVAQLSAQAGPPGRSADPGPAPAVWRGLVSQTPSASG
jgi:ribulose-5-phosphate 4-epimerase/fuculose-1-phosphate aldolase